MITQKRFFIVCLLAVLCLCGCDGLRFAATEAQKENAWLHTRVCEKASAVAVDAAVSTQLCDLTELAAAQSKAFVIDYGLPQEMSAADSVETLLSEGGVAAAAAKVDSAVKPDVWTLADSAMELGIALAGLVGGVYGVRVAGYLKTAREKSEALKEIVGGNELFKQLYPEQWDRFKQAQQKQSPSTRQLVAAAKTG